MDEAAGMQDQNIAPGTLPDAQDVALEKMLKQSEVNELVGKAKHAFYEKGRMDALEEMSRSQPQQTQSANQSNFGGGLGGMPLVTEDSVRKIIADEQARQTQITAAHNTLSNFASQVQGSKHKYSDFESVVAKLGKLENIPHIVELATKTGIAGDILYDLAKNPSKVASITMLAHMDPDNLTLASNAMDQLADSIKMNQQASQTHSANEPLSQIKPSPTGADNGSMSIRDLRKKYRA